MLRLYYNPKCSKSRAALERLHAAGLAPEVVDYIAQPPQRTELENLIGKLDVPAAQLLRGTPDGCTTTDTDVIATLLEQPQCLQRPIVETATQAIIARPPERVDAFLGIDGSSA